jgi:hypothetical protein
MEASASNRKIGKITSPVEAEARAREVISKKHSGVRRILFESVKQMENLWFLEGKVWFAFVFTMARDFRLNINCENGEETFYEETRSRT